MIFSKMLIWKSKNNKSSYTYHLQNQVYIYWMICNTLPFNFFKTLCRLRGRQGNKTSDIRAEPGLPWWFGQERSKKRRRKEVFQLQESSSCWWERPHHQQILCRSTSPDAGIDQQARCCSPKRFQRGWSMVEVSPCVLCPTAWRREFQRPWLQVRILFMIKISVYSSSLPFKY